MNSQALHQKEYRHGTLPNSGWRFLLSGEKIEHGDFAYHVSDSTYIPCAASVGRYVDHSDAGCTYIRLHSEDRTQDECEAFADAGDGWRILGAGEIVQKGDQYRYGFDDEKQKWIWRRNLERLGFPAEPTCVYRRRIDSAARPVDPVLCDPRFRALVTHCLQTLNASDPEHPDFLDSCADAIELFWGDEYTIRGLAHDMGIE